MKDIFLLEQQKFEFKEHKMNTYTLQAWKRKIKDLKGMMRLSFSSAQPLMFRKPVQSLSDRHSRGGEVSCFLQQWPCLLGPEDTIFEIKSSGLKWMFSLCVWRQNQRTFRLKDTDNIIKWDGMVKISILSQVIGSCEVSTEVQVITA